MSLNSIFQYFIPKDKKFFPLFEQDSANLIKLGEKLVEAVNTEDLIRRKELFKDISDLEHTGDEITHQIHLELSKNFITPFDRLYTWISQPNGSIQCDYYNSPN
jgi:uncharacterized protein Yka (UPF0111/DUF47 family)